MVDSKVVCWQAFRRSQKERGLAEVRLVTSDTPISSPRWAGCPKGLGTRLCRAISGPLRNAKVGRSRCLPGRLRALETRLDAP